MAIEFAPKTAPVKSAPAKVAPKPISAEGKKSTEGKKPKVAEAPKGDVALSGEKVLYQQRIDKNIADAMKRLDGSPSAHLQQAIIDYLVSRGAL